MTDARSIHRMLLGRKMPHGIVWLPRAIKHADELPEVLRVPAGQCLAVRWFTIDGVDDGRCLALVVRAGTTVSAAALRAALGASTVTAGVQSLGQDTVNGNALAAPLMLPDGVMALLDQEIMHARIPDDVIYTTTGDRDTALRIRAGDLFTVCQAKPIALGLPADFDLYYKSTVARFFGRAILLTANHSDAEDIVQDTFLALYRVWEEAQWWRDDERGRYLHRTLHNRAVELSATRSVNARWSNISVASQYW